MKKVVKWTVYGLILCALLALSICLMIIPEQTNEFIAKVMEYASMPIVVAGVSTTIGGVFVYIVAKYIFSNSKFGKKELEDLKVQINEAKKEITNEKDALKNFVEECTDKIDEFKDDCDTKITVMYEEFKDLQQSTINALKTIPNKKVQELVAKYEEEFATREEEIIEKTVDGNKFVNEKIAEIERKYEEFIKNVENALNEETIND